MIEFKVRAGMRWCAVVEVVIVNTLLSRKSTGSKMRLLAERVTIWLQRNGTRVELSKDR